MEDDGEFECCTPEDVEVSDNEELLQILGKIATGDYVGAISQWVVGELSDLIQSEAKKKTKEYLETLNDNMNAIIEANLPEKGKKDK